jgi:rhodanese-related sulfurtransferase
MAGSSIRELKRILDRGFHSSHRRPTVKTLRAQDLKQLRTEQKDLLLLNVLDEKAFEKEHIPGSEHVTDSASDFVPQVEALAGSKSRPIVVYCADRECPASPDAAKKLTAAGFTNVSHFAGGMAEWRKMGGKVEGMSTASTSQH